MESRVKIPYFIQELGHEIIAYILNISNEDSQKILEDTTSLEKTQKAILSFYIKIMQNIKIENIKNVHNPVYLSQVALITNDDKHMFNTFRELCGGVLPTITTDDKIETYLYQMALDSYPLFLLDWNDDFDIGIDASSIVDNGNLSNKLITALKNDDSLKYLFTDDTADINIRIKYYSSTGKSGMQLVFLPQLMIKKIYELMVLDRKYSIDFLEEYTKKIIQMYRELTDKKEIEVPCYIGYENIGLLDETSLSNIVPYDKTFFKRLPRIIRPTRNSSDMSYYGFMYKIDLCYKISLQRDESNIDYNSQQSKIEKEIKRLQLAFALASNEKIMSIKYKCTLVFDLFSYGTSIVWKDRKMTTNSNHMHLSVAQLTNVMSWLDKIKNDEKISIAINKILSAVNNRDEPLDSFIDTITALENMFCHNNTAVKAMLSKSIALLIENDVDKVFELFNTVRKLYKDRSDALHGNKELSSKEKRESMEKSLVIAIACLKKLYDTPKLLNESRRGKYIICKSKNKEALETKIKEDIDSKATSYPC